MRGLRIAIAEDDPDQRELLRHLLNETGASVDSFPTGEKLMHALRRESYDLLVLDWGLPGIQGPEIVKSVRETYGSRMPILFITNRSMERDIVAGLEAGADDYLVKPTRPAEFSARIQALLRRASPPVKADRLRFGPYVIDETKGCVQLHENVIPLQPRELSLAVFLFNNLGRVISRAHLIEAVLNTHPDSASRSLDTHMSRLRAKLQLGPANGFRLTSVYGVGYRLDAVAE